MKWYNVKVVYSAEKGGVRTSFPLPEDVCSLIEEMENTYPDGRLEIDCYLEE